MVVHASEKRDPLAFAAPRTAQPALRVVAGTAVPGVLAPEEISPERAPRFHVLAWFDLVCFVLLLTMLAGALYL